MTIYRARLVCPVDAPPILDGALAVDEAGRIAAIGRASDMPPGRAVELGHCLVLPGLINAHAHLDLAGPRDERRPASLWEWFETAILPRRLVTDDDVRRTVTRGAAESLAAGVTCIADASRTGESARALDGLPIRKVCFVEIISGGTRPPFDPATLAETIDRLLPLESPHVLRLGVSPHTPYTVTREHAAAAASLAGQGGRPLMTHFLETADERAWLCAAEPVGGAARAVQRFLETLNLPTRDDPRAESPIGWLRESGILASSRGKSAAGFVLAHVNYADDELIAALAGSGASVAYCPRTHDYFGHPPHRWREMLAAGVNVCLGTDSLASNPDLSILGELRFLRRQDRSVSPAKLLKLATVNAARAIGWVDVIGDLTPGRYADFLTVPLPDTLPADPVGWLLDGEARPSGVWLGGRPVGGSEGTQTDT